MEDFLQYHEDPYYGAKVVGGGVLLVWAVAECIYNETSATKLWNVSHTLYTYSILLYT